MKVQKRTKEILLQRLSDALEAMYHNATPHHPTVNEKLCPEYDNHFYFLGEQAVEYISDGLGFTDKEWQRQQKLGFSGNERYFWLVSQITRYGKLCTWGRGGRTLAPYHLIRQRGGSSFSIKSAENWEQTSNAELTEMIQIIEAFNHYVKHWNSEENLASEWLECLQYKRGELAAEAKQARLDIKQLAKDCRALVGIAGEAACGVLRAELKKQRALHRELCANLRDILDNIAAAKKEAQQ